MITGAGSGIGLIAARELAGVGARVVAAVRDPAKARAALADVAGSVEIRQLDVSDLGSIRAFVDATEGTVDVLVNNAGVMDIPAQRTADGFDLQTATNYFGPFVLTNLLADRITDRVVSVTSQLHRRAGSTSPTSTGAPVPTTRCRPTATPSWRRPVLPGAAAATATARCGQAGPLGARPPRHRHDHLAAHSAANRINRLRFLLNDPEHGALPTLYAATQDVPANAYVGPDGPAASRATPSSARPGKRGLDAEVASQLWKPLRRSPVSAP